MTPEQQDRYERARAEADLVYRLRTMESNAIVIRAKAPPEPRPTLWHRLRSLIAHSLHGSPSSYRARPSDPDLNPVSVSASASPATKEQQ